MMNEAIAKLQGDVMARYRSLVLQAATGGEVEPEAAINVISGVGRSAAQLAADVERLEERLAKQAAYDAKDYEGNRAELKAAIVEAEAESAKQAEASRKAREAHAKAHERLQSVEHRLHGLKYNDEKDTAELSEFMRKTGDGSNPEAFKLT